MTNFNTHQPMTYAVTAEPTMLTTELSVLESVILVAKRPGSPTKRWTVAAEEFSSMLFRYIEPTRAAKLLDRLKAGQVVELPGNYAPYDLVALGYRSAPHPPRKFATIGMHPKLKV
jgi:hypothetical protein